jgi:predicted Zn-dependent protease
MSIASDLVIPAIKDEYKFQDLCRDLWSKKYPSAQVKPYGRRGQGQDGVDVSVIDAANGLVLGIQCKATGDADARLSDDEIKECIRQAHAFEPKLQKLIIATTRKTDKTTQDLVNKINAEQVSKGAFTVEVLSWNEMLGDLKFHRDLIESYFNDFDWSGISKEQQGQLDHAASLLKKCRVRDANAVIANMRSRVWALTEPKISSRMLTIEANSKLILGLVDDGARLLKEAYQLDPHNEDRLCNYAHACLLENKNDEALDVLERVLSRNSENVQAYAIGAGIWAATQSLDEIISRIPKALHSNYRIASSIGSIARANGELEVAIKWYEIAINNLLPEIIGDISASFGELLLYSILSGKHFSSGELPKADEKERIEKAAKHLWEAIESVEDSSAFETRHPWLFNCSVAFAILGDSDKSIALADRALEFDPTNDHYLRHRAKLDFQKKGNSAKAFLDKIPSEDRNSGDWALLYSESLRKEGRKKDAIKVLRTFLEQSKEPLFRKEAFRLLFSLLIDERDAVAAEKLLKEIEVEQVGEVQTKLMQGQLLLLKGQRDEARGLILALDREHSDNLDFMLRRELGKLLRNLQEYGLAAKQFKKLQEQSHDKTVRLMVLENLFDAGEHGEALALARTILAEAGPAQFVSELATSLCEISGQLEDGLRICSEYLEKFPNDGQMKVHRALILYRQERIDDAKADLADDLDLKSLPARGWLNLIRLNGALGETLKALALAYEARRCHFGDSEIHNTLIAAHFVATQQEGVLQSPTTVQSNCAVQLRTRGTTYKWLVVEDRKDLQPSLLEHGLDHPIVRAIWGLKCGDQVQLSLGTFEPEPFEIVQICDKYIYAAYDSMERFAELFPNDSGPLKLIVPRENSEPGKVDLNPLYKIVAGQSDRSQRCLDLYKAGLITIGAFAEMVGRHMSDVLCALIQGSGISLYVCLGNVEEAEEQFELLRQQPEKLVFDLISVASLVHLGVGDVVGEQVKERALVTQSTLDLLRSEISFHSATREKGYKVLSVVDGLPQLQDVTQEQVAFQINFLNSIDAWFKRYAKVDSSGKELALQWKQRDGLNEILGASFVDSLLVASQKGYVLVSDDCQLRMLGRNEFGIRSVWTGNLIVHLNQLGIVSTDKVENFFIQAIASRYRHVPISPQLLLRAVKNSGWMVDEKSAPVIDSLKDPVKDSFFKTRILQPVLQ